MNSYIIDTNVLITANGDYPKANYKDIFQCQRFLLDMRKNLISIDSLGLIFKEYFNQVRRSGQPGMGDAFAKWLWDNQGYISKCELVEITPDIEGGRGFKEFPTDERLKNFDWEDRKFVAVAVTSKNEAVICNATDSDWWDFRAVFKILGIEIKFLCPGLFKPL